MAERHVLIEHQNPRTAVRLAEAFRAAGFSAEVCGGPRSQPDGTCPLVIGDGCPAIDQADVVLNGLPLGDIRIFIAQRARKRNTAVVLSLSDNERARVPVLDYLGTVVPRDMAASDLITLVDVLRD